MAGTRVTRIRTWLLDVGRNKRSLEPTRRASAYGWTNGWHRVAPSAHAKHLHLMRLLKARRHSIFVEAGTYRGETVAYLLPYAKEIVSVELHDGLYAEAAARFADAKSVRIVHGDSTVEIPRIVAECTSPPLVFLDGHYSGSGTASGDELEPAVSTLARLGAVAPPGTTVVVDDLRLFGSGVHGAPQLDEVALAARQAFPTATIRAGLDSVVIEVP